MRKVLFGGLVAAGLAVTLAVGSAAIADEDGEITRLDGYFESPVVATPGAASLRLRLDEENKRLEWQLAWRDLENGATPTQAHIHFGQRDVNGGIVLWLCTNLRNAPGPPAPQPAACPTDASGEISGVATPAHVAPNAAQSQGLDAGNWDEFVQALKTGVTYVNIHSARFSTGELRGNIGRDRRDDNVKDEDKELKKESKQDD